MRRAAEGSDKAGVPARMIIVDSLNGYLNAMPEEKFLTAQLHELLSYLGQQGVVTIMTVTQAGMVGNMASPVDTTYLADNVILFRFFEAAGTFGGRSRWSRKETGTTNAPFASWTWTQPASSSVSR